MYWVLKSFFKGDPEFSYEKFPSLPYEYVFLAYIRAGSRRQMELHEYEQPLALQTSQTANINRDVKRRKKPYEVSDFYMFQPKELTNTPAERYGAAAVSLANQSMLPGWSLFCFQELRKGAGRVVPPLVAFMGEGALLLAPMETEMGWTGMLIAQKEASQKAVEMTSPCGRQITLRMPTILDPVAAEEDIELTVVG